MWSLCYLFDRNKSIVAKRYVVRGWQKWQAIKHGHILTQIFCGHDLDLLGSRGNQGECGVNLNDTIRLAIPENHTLEPKFTTFIHSRSYNRLKNCLIFPIGAIVIFWFLWIKTLNITFQFLTSKRHFLVQNCVVWCTKCKNHLRGLTCGCV